MTKYELEIQESATYILERTKYSPEILIILGSGLGKFGDNLENAEYYDYKDIPNFPVSTVESHKSRLIISGKIMCMQGRFHFYEGYTMQEVTFPIRVASRLGIKTLIATNASGGVNLSFSAGDLMIIKDHINYMGTNPLMGKNLDSFGERFIDMTNCYDKEYIKIIKEAAKNIGLDIKEGVYIGFTGPSFETPAEIKMARIMGGDAVGMSTVPEIIVAAHCGIRSMGISCITNLAAGVLDQPLDHREVIVTANMVKNSFISLLNEIIKLLEK
ncbi:Purine nucleoside phosphorylase 1 [bioreactor metagenome]|uniref:purine-nucleoside phosphorylase n=1 Tax=bioreactor metagenome TaxID=1076179 RepID=A0A645BYG4_9ZZZZ